MTTIIVAPTSTAAGTMSSASGALRFGSGFVNSQRSPAQVGPVERRDGLVGLTAIGHFHEPEPTGAASIPVSYECDLFHRTVCLEKISQLSFSRVVGQIPNVKVLHRYSFLNKSARLVGVEVRFDGRSSESRGGGGTARIAWVRARAAERTAEIRREASRMPHRFVIKSPLSGGFVSFAPPMTVGSSPFSIGNSSSSLGESARYSGRPTRKASRCGGVALRRSSQNLSRCPGSFSILINTRSYNAGLHHDRASAMSAALSTSIPSFRRTSARKSRLVCELSISSTRFFLIASGIAAERAKDVSGVFMPAPTGAWCGRKHSSIWAPLPPVSAVPGFSSVERSSVCALD